MKLQRYNQFVKRINEERTSDYRTKLNEPEMGHMVDDEEGYDSVADFRKEMEETEEVPMTNFDADADLNDDDMEMDMDDDDMYMDDEDMDMDDDDMDMAPDMRMEPGMDEDDDMDMSSDYSGVDSEKKLYDLARMLGVEVVENEVKFGDQVINYYSETGKLHIGSKSFDTAEEAAEYLQGGTPRMMRDTNESRSYRFNRKRK